MSPGTDAPTPADKRRALRELIEDARVAELPGVYDGLSARVAQEQGFAGAFISGGSVSNSRLGQPDVGLLGWEGNVEASRVMAGIVDIPLLADADTGYGSAGTVHFVTRWFEDAGVAGLFIEDQTWPKKCGYIAGGELIAEREMATKVASAVESRLDDAFVVMARTDAHNIEGLPAAIRRGRSYLNAGADIVFPDALHTRDQIGRFVEAVDGPVCVNMGLGLRARPPTELVAATELQDLGVAVVIYPRILICAALAGMRRALQVLRGSATEKDVDPATKGTVAPFSDLTDLMGLPEITARDNRLGGSSLAELDQD